MTGQSWWTLSAICHNRAGLNYKKPLQQAAAADFNFLAGFFPVGHNHLLQVMAGLQPWCFV